MVSNAKSGVTKDCHTTFFEYTVFPPETSSTIALYKGTTKSQ